MRISEVRISLRDDDKLRAFATVTLDDCFVIRGLKVIQGSQRLFVAMPARRRPDGTFQDVVHPINAATRLYLEREVLDAYQRAVRDGGGAADQGDEGEIV
jgi:stage V sporulation protein G